MDSSSQNDALYLSNRVTIGATAVDTLYIYFKPAARADTAFTMYIMVHKMESDSKVTKMGKVPPEQVQQLIEQPKERLDEPFPSVWNVNELSALAKYYFILATEAGYLDLAGPVFPLNETFGKILLRLCNHMGAEPSDDDVSQASIVSVKQKTRSTSKSMMNTLGMKDLQPMKRRRVNSSDLDQLVGLSSQSDTVLLHQPYGHATPVDVNCLQAQIHQTPVRLCSHPNICSV